MQRQRGTIAPNKVVQKTSSTRIPASNKTSTVTTKNQPMNKPVNQVSKQTKITYTPQDYDLIIKNCIANGSKYTDQEFKAVGTSLV